jgi:methionyl-tRNA formyltransferase
MKLIFFGTSVFAIPALERLAGSVELVVSQPDRPTGRGLKFQPSPLKARTMELGISVETPVRCRTPEFISFIRRLKADALVVAAYGQILPVPLLESAQHGAVNLHGSLLPKYRGAAPIQRAIFVGEAETGVTLMQMDRGMDTGDEIARASTPIGPDETYGELQDRLALLAADLCETWMPKIAAGEYVRIPQDSDQATYAPKVEKSEAELRIENPAELEYRRFRAFTPAPGANLRTAFGNMRIDEARLCEGDAVPGSVVATRPELVVAFGSGAIRLLRVRPEGKKPMSGSDWANGVRLSPGDRIIE